jgi:putative ATPase
VPSYLRDTHYTGAQQIGHGQGYLYPHDMPGGVAAQQYAPDAVANRTYYRPTRYGAESRLADLWDKLRTLLRG